MLRYIIILSVSFFGLFARRGLLAQHRAGWSTVGWVFSDLGIWAGSFSVVACTGTALLADPVLDLDYPNHTQSKRGPSGENDFGSSKLWQPSESLECVIKLDKKCCAAYWLTVINRPVVPGSSLSDSRLMAQFAT